MNDKYGEIEDWNTSEITNMQNLLAEAEMECF